MFGSAGCWKHPHDVYIQGIKAQITCLFPVLSTTKNSKHPFMYKCHLKCKDTLQDQSCVKSSLYLNHFIQGPLTIAKQQKLCASELYCIPSSHRSLTRQHEHSFSLSDDSRQVSEHEHSFSLKPFSGSITFLLLLLEKNWNSPVFGGWGKKE